MRLLLVVTIASLTLGAFFFRFIQDDAFISFRYAEHLAQGAGPVWNVGEPPIEGFTNPLWTGLIAGAIRLKIDPVHASYAIGLAAFAGTLFATYRLVLALGCSPAAACGVMVVLGLNASVNRYATGGLETSLQTMFFAVAAWLCLQAQKSPTHGIRRLTILSMILGLAIWTRLDSVLVAASLLAPLLWAELRRRPSPGVRALAAMLLPCVALTVALLGAKYAAFGGILPNTFHAKVTTGTSKALVGFEYVVAFFRNYGLLIPLLIAMVQRPRLGAGISLGVTFAVWIAYVILVGGDFMEFRLIVPALPLLFAWTGAAVVKRLSPALATAIAGALILESGLYVYSTSDEIYEYDGAGIETINGLERRVQDPSSDWIGIGRTLGLHFSDVPETTIAVGAAGAIPFYSKLRTIDLLGLNDAWVARNGIIEGRRAGHVRHAPVRYLVDQKVSFIVTWAPAPPSRRASYAREDAFGFFPFGDIADLPAEMGVVEIPMGDSRVVSVLYLVKNAAVDARIASKGLRVIPVK